MIMLLLLAFFYNVVVFSPIVVLISRSSWGSSATLDSQRTRVTATAGNGPEVCKLTSSTTFLTTTDGHVSLRLHSSRCSKTLARVVACEQPARIVPTASMGWLVAPSNTMTRGPEYYDMSARKRRSG